MAEVLRVANHPIWIDKVHLGILRLDGFEVAGRADAQAVAALAATLTLIASGAAIVAYEGF